MSEDESAISGSGMQDAPEVLAELTGRDAEEFRAEDYPIPDFEDQEIIIPDGGETDAQSVDVTYRCEIHDFKAHAKGQMQQHIDHEHPGGAAKDSVEEFRVDEDRFTDCEECGEPVDMLKAGVWKAPNDEQWWHEGCYDKVEKAEELAKRIRNLMVPEGEFDGLSNDFHDQLDAAQAALETAVQRERLKRDQGIGPYSTETDRSGGDR